MRRRKLFGDATTVSVRLEPFELAQLDDLRQTRRVWARGWRRVDALEPRGDVLRRLIAAAAATGKTGTAGGPGKTDTLEPIGKTGTRPRGRS
jgi:hypothetical protein